MFPWLSGQLYVVIALTQSSKGTRPLFYRSESTGCENTLTTEWGILTYRLAGLLLNGGFEDSFYLEQEFLLDFDTFWFTQATNHPEVRSQPSFLTYHKENSLLCLAYTLYSFCIKTRLSVNNQRPALYAACYCHLCSISGRLSNINVFRTSWDISTHSEGVT